MRKLGYPERIVFLMKQTNVNGKQARVAEVLTDAGNEFARDRNLVYRGPAAEEWAFELLQKKLVSTYSLIIDFED